MSNRILLSGVAVLALVAPLASGPAQATSTPHSPIGAVAPFSLRMPRQVTAESYDGVAYLDHGPTLVTGNVPFELRATRASYHDPIQVRWLKASGTVTLPSGTMTDFSGLPGFFRVQVRGPKGKVFDTKHLPLCPDGESARARPDAPAHNPYPSGCPANPFTLGSVIGLQAGWYTTFGQYAGSGLKLKPGRYSMLTSVATKYRAIFGLTTDRARQDSVLTVTKMQESDYRTADRSTAPAAAPAAKPAAARPAGTTEAPVDGPKPDLRSLPAFGMRISPKGNYLQFSATVWNGGAGPMVVDGFRHTKNLMDAYQYFFDTSGNQVGYQQVGTMQWDPRPSHHHWHFTDFARYQLLNADRSLVRLSEKEAFCLANTDAVDYTLPAADWHPEGTDLGTACGDYGSMSVRESLASGSGDTYDQTRAGQSFDLKGLRNGTYYVSVEANPEHTLVETSTTNNNSLRKIRIGGRLGHRTVQSWPVGLVDDSSYGGGYFRTR